MPSDTNTANSRINGYWEKWGIWVAVALLSICAYTFQEQKSRIDKLESNVQQLYMDKVSKEDMKEFEIRVSKQVDSVKGDILSRMDFYLAKPSK